MYTFVIVHVQIFRFPNLLKVISVMIHKNLIYIIIKNYIYLLVKIKIKNSFKSLFQFLFNWKKKF